MLALRTLGGLSITEEERVVAIGGLRNALCLAYLRHHADRRVPRSELLEVLWSDDSQRARHSLSQCLYALRRAFRKLDLVASVDHVLLSSAGFYYDLEDLQHAIHAGLLTVAAHTYRGQFLEGIRAYPTLTMEQWGGQVARKASGLAISAFRGLCRQAEISGTWHDVEMWANKLLELDDLDEEAHAQRIRAVAAQLGVEAACRLAKDVRAQFTAELGGIAGSDLCRTCDKYADVDAGGAELVPTHDTPIRGRTEEFRTMSSSWVTADAGRHQLVLISGPAGIGKTRLGTHLLRWAAVRGSRVLTAKASHSDTHLPYAIIVQMLRSGLRKTDVLQLPEPWRQWLVTLLPEYGDTLAECKSTYPDPGQRELFESVARLSMPLCQSAPLTVFLDDFDLCDQASAWLISFLFQRLASERFVLVLASRRTPDEFPEHASALVKALNDTQITLLPLSALEHSASGQIAQDRMARTQIKVAPAAIAEIIEYAKGVPYFLLEAADAIASSSNDRAGANTSLSGSYGILSTVRLLPKHARTVLRALAVLGYRAPRALVRATSQYSPAEFADAIAHLSSKRLIRPSGQYVEFDHDLTREAVLADISEEEGRYIHRCAAFAISNMACAPPGRLAIHYTAADIPEQAYRAAMTAADEAARVHAPDDVEFYLRLAISKAPSNHDRLLSRAALVEHFCVLEMYHEAQCLLTSWPDVWSHLNAETADLLRVFTTLTDTSCSATAFLAHLETLWPSGEGRLNDGARLRLLRTIIGLTYQIGSSMAKELTFKLVEKSSSLDRTADTAKLLACLARSWAVMEGGSKSLELANRAVGMAVELDDKPSIGFSLLSRATVSMLMGDLLSAEDDYAACHDVVQAPALLALAVRRTVNRSVLLIETSRPHEASDSLQGILPFHVPLEQLFVRGNMALAALEMREPERLMKRVGEMRSINGAMGLAWVDHFADCMEAYCLAQRGQAAASRHLVSRLAQAEQTKGVEVLGPDPSYAQALVGDWLGNSSQERALEYLEEAARRHAGRNVLGEIRVRLARTRVLLNMGGALGRQELRELISLCKKGGALTLLGHCERLATVSELSLT